LSFPRRQIPAMFPLVLALGCAADVSARKEIDALRAEVRALRRENEALAQRVESLGAGVEALSARHRAVPPGRTASPAVSSPAAAPAQGPAAAPEIPPDLAVVKMAPQQPPAAARRRSPPPVSTAIPIEEPDPERLAALGRRGGRSLAAEADAELSAARAETGTSRAHALEDFAARYPRHPSADNALVEAAASYAEAGRDEPACGLARKAAEGYPAGDAMSDVLERLAWCESRRGAADLERQLLERLVAEYPRSAAARRAGPRLAATAAAGHDRASAPHPVSATEPAFATDPASAAEPASAARPAPAPRSGP
jgi:TolA-binding protein